MSLAVLTPYYKEHATNDYLSKTFESSVIHTPSFTNRRTASQENYLKCRGHEKEDFKTPWGRKYSYGGMAVVQLPHDHRPKGEPPLQMQKGSMHYGSGLVAEPRGVPVHKFYSSTSLQRKSNTRDSDELVPSPNKVNISKHQIDLNYPQEHPYASHNASYRNVITPTCVDTNDNSDVPLSAETPAMAADIGIIDKARGGQYRHETLSIPLNSQRQPMTWPGGPSYFKILKGSNREKRVYYPVPSNQNNPSLYYAKSLYPRTVKALNDLRVSQWKTTYQRDYDRTDKPYENLDSEETLMKITAGPNAMVPKSLMADATTPDGIKQTVEEISGETARKDRMVHFEQLHDKFEPINDNPIQSEPISNKSREFPRPIIKDKRPFSSFEVSNQVINESNQRFTKSAQVRNPKGVAAEQSWSRSDFARKFNVKYYNDDRTNLYDKQSATFQREPQKNYIRTSLLN